MSEISMENRLAKVEYDVIQTNIDNSTTIEELKVISDGLSNA